MTKSRSLLITSHENLPRCAAAFDGRHGKARHHRFVSKVRPAKPYRRGKLCFAVSDTRSPRTVFVRRCTATGGSWNFIRCLGDDNVLCVSSHRIRGMLSTVRKRRAYAICSTPETASFSTAVCGFAVCRARQGAQRSLQRHTVARFCTE